MAVRDPGSQLTDPGAYDPTNPSPAVSGSATGGTSSTESYVDPSAPTSTAPANTAPATPPAATAPSAPTPGPYATGYVPYYPGGTGMPSNPVLTPPVIASDPGNVPAPTDLMSRIQAALAAAGSTDDPNYWYQKISADPNGAGSAWDYWVSRINQGNGAAAVRNGTTPLFNDPGTGAAPGQGAGTGFADPAYQALNALAQAQLARLQQPQDFPQLDALASQLQANEAQQQQRATTLAGQLTDRVTQLQQPLLTQPQVVQQQALAQNNLLASRDAAIQAAKDSQSARGFAPTSGLALDQANQINQNASNQQASINAQLQQANIQSDEQRRNEATSLQGLAEQALNGGDATALQEQAQVADLENQAYQTDQQRQIQQLATAQIPVDLTNQGYANASGAITSPSSALSSLMSLIGSGLTGQSNAFGQANSQAAGQSQLMAQILAALGL